MPKVHKRGFAAKTSLRKKTLKQNLTPVGYVDPCNGHRLGPATRLHCTLLYLRFLWRFAPTTKNPIIILQYYIFKQMEFLEGFHGIHEELWCTWGTHFSQLSFKVISIALKYARKQNNYYSLMLKLKHIFIAALKRVSFNKTFNCLSNNS